MLEEAKLGDVKIGSVATRSFPTPHQLAFVWQTALQDAVTPRPSRPRIQQTMQPPQPDPRLQPYIRTNDPLPENLLPVLHDYLESLTDFISSANGFLTKISRNRVKNPRKEIQNLPRTGPRLASTPKMAVISQAITRFTRIPRFEMPSLVSDDGPRLINIL